MKLIYLCRTPIVIFKEHRFHVFFKQILSLAVANAILSFDPEVVVIKGRIGLAYYNQTDYALDLTPYIEKYAGMPIEDK